MVTVEGRERVKQLRNNTVVSSIEPACLFNKDSVKGKDMATPDVETVLLESVELEDSQTPELQDLVSVDGLITEPVLGIRMLMSSRVSHVVALLCNLG